MSHALLAFTRRKWVRAYGRVEASSLLISGDEHGMSGPGDLSQPFALNLKQTLLVIGVSRYPNTFSLTSKKTKEPIVWLRFKTLEDYDAFKLIINEFTDPMLDLMAKPAASGPRPGAAGMRDERSGSLSMKSDDHPLRSLAWDESQKTVAAVDAAAQKYMHGLQILGISYRRSTQVRCGWSYGKGGSLAPYPSESRSKIHPGKKWDGRVDEVIGFLAEHYQALMYA